MKTKIFIATLFLVMLMQTAFSQTAIIKGLLVDEESKLPIAYASVALLNADTTIVTGKLSNTKGNFEFSELKAGAYLLKYVIVGYKTKYSTVINLSADQPLNLGQIVLTPAVSQLKQVNLAGIKPNSSNKIDKQSYRADQFETAKGGTAIDVLKNLPSVSVNGEGEISVRGTTGFLVLNNGKPVLTDIQTILNQLPANSVQNIELITSPSAKYDPDGKAGIVNIVTKTGTTKGLTLTANAQYGLPSTGDFDNQHVSAGISASTTKKTNGILQWVVIT